MKKCFYFLTLLLFSFQISAQNPIIHLDTTYTFAQAPSTSMTFDVDISRPGLLKVILSGWESTYNWSDPDKLYLYNSVGETVGREVFANGNEIAPLSDPYLGHMFEGDTVKIRVGKSGMYSLQLRSGFADSDWNGKTSQHYDMKLTVEDATDQFEPNDTFGDAKEIQFDVEYLATQWRQVSSDSVYWDSDIYKIELPSPGRIVVNMTNWLPYISWGGPDKFYIYDSEGESAGYGTGSESDPYYTHMMFDDPEKIGINLGAAGVYYLRFYSGLSYQTEPYKFEVSFVPVNDNFEPNDEMAEAYQVETFGQEHEAYQWKSQGQNLDVINDDDYYKLSVLGEGELKITLKNWNATVNWSNPDLLYVYDSAGNAFLGTGYDSNPYYTHMMFYDPDITTITLPSAGDYYVRLHSGSNYSFRTDTETIESYTVQFDYSGLTGTNDNEELPKEYFLSQNFPNPFNPATSIKYGLPYSSSVRIEIYDILGRVVEIVIDEFQSAGFYHLNWNASSLTSGIYFCRISAHSTETGHQFSSIKKLTLLK